MSKAITKTCQICGKEYPACSYCEQRGEGYSWRTVVCCREHFNFHAVIIQYVRNQITKEVAKAELLAAEERYGKIDYLPEIQVIVDEIFANPKSVRKRNYKTNTTKS